MTMCNDNLFAPQAFTKEQERAAICSNMTIDFSLAHYSVLEEFVQREPDYAAHLRYLSRLTNDEIRDQAELARTNTMLMTVVMLTGECNAHCRICYTNRRKDRNGLSAPQVMSLMDQSYALGSRLLVIPGEGEPTLDKGLFSILGHARAIGMSVILFTNGILLSDDNLALAQWGVTCEEMADRLRELPVYIYHKLWSTKPELTASLLGIRRSAYKSTALEVATRSIQVPIGLALLLDRLPRERIGIETVVMRENWQEILDDIIPLVQHLRLKHYIEPIIHAGRCLGNRSCDPPPHAMVLLKEWLSRQGCRRLAYKTVVHNDGTISYGMALSAKELRRIHGAGGVSNAFDKDGRSRNLFDLIHTNPALVWGRYQTRRCICEELNLRLGLVGGSCDAPVGRSGQPEIARIRE